MLCYESDIEADDQSWSSKEQSSPENKNLAVADGSAMIASDSSG